MVGFFFENHDKTIALKIKQIQNYKLMKKIITGLLIFIAFPLLAGPKIDEKRMQRDLEIAKSVLITLIKSESAGFYGEKIIEAKYVDGYGVIFNIPNSIQFFFDRTPFEFDPAIIEIPAIPAMPSSSMMDKGWTDKLSEEELEEIEEYRQEAEIYRQEAEEYKQEAEKYRQEAEKAKLLAYKDQMKAEQVKEPDWKNIMITFLADYADVIGQLKPGDKIMINRESPNNEMYYVWQQNNKEKDPQNNQVSGLSAEVTKKNISAYKSGKLTLEEFEKRITIKEKKPQKKIPDLEMFSSIFKRYFSPDLSETFFTQGSPKYELLEGFGAVFNIKTYSSYVEEGVYFIPATGQKNVNSSDRDVIIDQLYPKFVENLKQFIIDYGRTIRSLEDTDHLMLKIKTTRCWDCKIPKYIELTIKIKDLKAYDRQKLSPEKALAAIEIKEIF